MEDGIGNEAPDTGGQMETQTQSGGSATIPLFETQTQPDTGTLPEFSSVIPAEYKDAAWVKDVPDLNTFFKNHSDMKTAMGKRAIPGEGATDEQWAEFNKGFAPESADKYQLETIADDHPNKELQAKFQEGVRNMFLEAGVHPRQAALLEKGFNALNESLGGEAGAPDPEETANFGEESFNKMADEKFGEGKAEAFANMKRLLGVDADALLTNVPNKDIMNLAENLDKIYKANHTEDEIPNGGDGAPGLSVKDRRARSNEIMNSAAFKDEFHPDHKQAMEEWNNLYK